MNHYRQTLNQVGDEVIGMINAGQAVDHTIMLAVLAAAGLLPWWKEDREIKDRIEYFRSGIGCQISLDCLDVVNLNPEVYRLDNCDDDEALTRLDQLVNLGGVASLLPHRPEHAFARDVSDIFEQVDINMESIPPIISRAAKSLLEAGVGQTHRDLYELLCNVEIAQQVAADQLTDEQVTRVIEQAERNYSS